MSKIEVLLDIDPFFNLDQGYDDLFMHISLVLLMADAFVC
jgi:hypothetical protein